MKNNYHDSWYLHTNFNNGDICNQYSNYTPGLYFMNELDSNYLELVIDDLENNNNIDVLFGSLASKELIDECKYVFKDELHSRVEYQRMLKLEMI